MDKELVAHIVELVKMELRNSADADVASSATGTGRAPVPDGDGTTGSAGLGAAGGHRLPGAAGEAWQGGVSVQGRAPALPLRPPLSSRRADHRLGYIYPRVGRRSRGVRRPEAVPCRSVAWRRRRPASRRATVRILHGELRPASGLLKASLFRHGLHGGVRYADRSTLGFSCRRAAVWWRRTPVLPHASQRTAGFALKARASTLPEWDSEERKSYRKYNN